MLQYKVTIVVILSLFIVFFSQGYLVYDYYSTTRDGLIRESDAILDEVFREELNKRNTFYKHLTGEDTLKTPPPATVSNVATFTPEQAKEFKDNISMLLQLTMNTFVSKTVPTNILMLDSIAGAALNKRRIESKYTIRILSMPSMEILQQSKENRNSIFEIISKPLYTNLDKSNALQLVLINPFGLILQRMALMLITSLVFSVICVLAFVYLQRILARQKQLVAFKNEFLGTIAHELKRPVASLVFNLDCLSQSAQVTSGGQNAMLLQSSLRATGEMNDSINMIVNLTKLEEGMLELRHEQIGLMQMLEELKDRFTGISPKKPDISISCEPQLKTLWGDRQLLMQCFANLIDNAIKYSGDEVRIQISVRSEDNRVLVSVRDNGFGIPADKLVFLFDKYSRLHTDATKINGFGIGLNYVKNIVEKHRGEVRVASEPGQGSEFCVLLPVA
ncbi:MAG: HAMP domain-containing sensor histidine kinase [Paludibacter sp.]|nr:HAMP domain-containing sensor histidine kinase [Paludibacter sp.]